MAAGAARNVAGGAGTFIGFAAVAAFPKAGRCRQRFGRCAAAIAATGDAVREQRSCLSALFRKEK